MPPFAVVSVAMPAPPVHGVPRRRTNSVRAPRRATPTLVGRLHYLEGFLRLCAWCRKLHADNEWIPLEEFMQRRFDTRTSHGICPACKAEQRKAERTRP